jgi:hypothetical protein
MESVGRVMAMRPRLHTCAVPNPLKAARKEVFLFSFLLLILCGAARAAVGQKPGRARSLPIQPRVAVINNQYYHMEIVAGIVEATKAFRNSSIYFLNPEVFPGYRKSLGFFSWLKDDLKCESSSKARPAAGPCPACAAHGGATRAGALNTSACMQLGPAALLVGYPGKLCMSASWPQGPGHLLLLLPPRSRPPHTWTKPHATTLLNNMQCHVATHIL